MTTRPPSAIVVSLAGMLSLAAAMGIGRFAFTPVLPLMIRDGHLQVAAGGWLAAANYLGYLVGAVAAARVAASASRLTWLSLAGIAITTGAMTLHAATSWLALRFVAGACSAGVFVATSVWCLGALDRMQRDLTQMRGFGHRMRKTNWRHPQDGLAPVQAFKQHVATYKISDDPALAAFAFQLAFDPASVKFDTPAQAGEALERLSRAPVLARGAYFARAMRDRQAQEMSSEAA